MGCCGHDFISKEKIKEAIVLNNREFEDYSPYTKDNLILFRDRAHKNQLRWGVCLNLIEKDNQIFCPLHPLLNNNVDLRENHCAINHMCKTAQEFETWNKEKQQQFLNLIKEKNMDNLDYSLAIDQEILLKEFKEKISNNK